MSKKIIQNIRDIVLRCFANNSQFIDFRFENGQIIIRELQQWKSRGDSIIKIIKKIKVKYPEAFPEYEDILVTFWDRPCPVFLYWLYKTSFNTTIFTGIKGWGYTFKYIPCPYFDGWSEIGLDSSDDLIKRLYENTTKSEINKVFWIGANTHSSRVLLAKLADKNPEIFDVCVMSWDQDGEDDRLKSKTRYVSLYDHSKYKYLIDCQGNGYSARLKWLLATGRPVFVIDRDIVEPWFQSLKPFEHYIPVKENLSDLLEKYKMVENNPELYEKISINAKNFAINNLLLDQQIDTLFNK